MQNEYIDLPINIQQTPRSLLQKSEAYKVPEKPGDAANQLLKTLQTLTKGSSNDLYTFYQISMVSTLKQRFTDKDWPETSTLENEFETQYKPSAIAIYKQFVIRNTWYRAKGQKDLEKYCSFINDAWDQYTFIFKLQSGRVNFPAEMIWDYFDQFLDIYLFHRQKAGSLTQTKNFKEQNFSSNSTKAVLKQMSTAIPSSFNQNCSVKQIFGYYSIVALAVIEASEGNYKEALQYISRISLKETSILSKGLGSLLTAFFIAAFSYFMLQQYYKSVKICETIVPFYQKYRKFFDKSFSYYSQLLPIYQKLVILQSINYIFLEQKPKTLFIQIFKNTYVKIKQKEKQVNLKTKEKEARDKISDCFYKMKQNDVATFWRLFNYISAQYSLPNIQKTITQKFKSLQSVNINTIIQNYRKIQLQKIEKMLGISTKQILKKFKSLGEVQKTQSPWDSTIMNPLLKQKKKVNVVIEGNVAIFDSQNVDPQEASREWTRYREEISWLSEKVKAI